MATVEALQNIATQLSDLCSHISVREDEGVPYIFALGTKGVHTLQLRRAPAGGYVVELWLGASAESERVTAEPSFPTLEAASVAARAWLEQDAA